MKSGMENRGRDGRYMKSVLTPRPPKDQFNVKLPREIAGRVREEAKIRGQTYSEYLADTLITRWDRG